jgi:hypothetical protein
MKAILGGICFVLGLLCAGGLFFSTIRLAWAPIEGFNPAIAFFGFGIPMLILGGATVGLWESHHLLIKWCFGGSCIVLGLCNAIGLLAVLAGWVGLIPGRLGESLKAEEAFVCLAAFGIPMLVCGGAGIGILTGLQDPRAEPHVKLGDPETTGRNSLGLQDPCPETQTESKRDSAPGASPESATYKPWWLDVAQAVMRHIR